VPATLVISDLHLSGERPAINERFFAFLREQAARASALYVLGDLFEYWIGDEELDAADGDPLGRDPGDPLVPDRFSVAFIHSQMSAMGSYLSSALLQQDPTPEEGTDLLRAWFHLYEQPPAAADQTCPRGDAAATSEDLAPDSRQESHPGWPRWILDAMEALSPEAFMRAVAR